MGDHLGPNMLSFLHWLCLAEILGKLGKFTKFYSSVGVLKKLKYT